MRDDGPVTANKRTVYAASSGAYSDYTVRALFEDRADAEATVARMNTSRFYDAYVEEFDLFPAGSGDALVARPRYEASLGVGMDGVLIDAEPDVEFTTVDADVEPVSPPVCLETWDGRDSYEVSVMADDEPTAVKAVRERAARVAAQLVEGIDPITGRPLDRSRLTGR
jgi:hypothetical protein